MGGGAVPLEPAAEMRLTLRRQSYEEWVDRRDS